MRTWLVLVCVVAWSASSARADDAVECDKSRDVCDAKILELCPTGADVLDEREVPGPAAGVARYRITFRCRNAGAAEVPLAPAPAPDAQAAPDAAVVEPTKAPPPAQNPEELASVDARIAELEAERRQHSLVGPIVLTSIGLGSALTFLAVAVSAKDTADSTITDFDSDFDTSTGDEDSYRTTAKVFGGLTVVGVAVAAGGGLWLWRRVAARREHKPELDELKARRQQLRAGVSYGFAVDPATRSLWLTGRF